MRFFVVVKQKRRKFALEINFMLRIIIIAFSQSALLAVAQFLLKIGLNKVEGSYAMTWSYIKQYLSWQMCFAGIIYIIAMAVWLYMLKKFPLSLVYPLTSISYIFTIVLSIIFLQEKIFWPQWIGVAFIMFGVSLLAIKL